MAASNWRPKQTLAQKLARTSSSMTPGTVNGRIGSARQASVPAKTRRNPPLSRNVCFSIVEPTVGEDSPPYIVQATGIVMSISASGAGTGKFTVKLNGTAVAAITKTSAAYNVKDGLSIDVDPFDKITVALAAGSPTSVVVQIEILES